jgi:hypothetical protein
LSAAAHAEYRAELDREFWRARYLLYQQYYESLQLPVKSFEDFKAYWKIFGKDSDFPASAPILVQRA